MRTCVGCRERAAKADLLRLVVAAGGSVRLDRDGSGPGRGAYVHPRRSCAEAALSLGALARGLRTGLDERGAATLRTDIEGELDR
ncbi:MAG TPA: YlxR family protein [Actinomycetota bacterium]|nr:YlxR family protein [Actinomycetota bacterium]